jgi:selenocysteine lyase/cysteine desulfurase
MRSLGHYFNPHKTLQDKIGLGGSSYELVYAIPAVVEYLGSGDGPSKWEGIIRHETELQETLLRYLTGRDDVIVWGERSSDARLRVPTISFTVRGWNSKELVESVEKETNFGFRFGTFYSVRLVTELLGLVGEGDAGVVRVSMVHYNTGNFLHLQTSLLIRVAN